MTMEPNFSGISHLDLSVANVEVSAAWYIRVLGVERIRLVEAQGRIMIVLVHPPTGLIIGLNQHDEHPGEIFDERRSGLDHVGFSVKSRSELDSWRERLDALGVAHSPVTDAERGSALVFRDPDNIQLEFWWSKPSA